jgi:7-cyano-7-deazaguanine reductase
MQTVNDSPLGKAQPYIAEYQSDLLFPLPRLTKRDEIMVPAILPFSGADIWTGFEISWLNTRGKPQVALAEFIFPCETPHIIESKSFKLYLNSFNNTQFASQDSVTETMRRDLSKASGASIRVKLFDLHALSQQPIQHFQGINLDQQDISCNTYLVNPDYLVTEDNLVAETVFSDLLKSNCLVTGQPDWGSVKIQYSGKQIQHAGLLKYIVSFRNHNEFHEQCVERIFMNIMQRCAPAELSVEARYTRRGGLDINPYRSTDQNYQPQNIRQARQ